MGGGTRGQSPLIKWMNAFIWQRCIRHSWFDVCGLDVWPHWRYSYGYLVSFIISSTEFVINTLINKPATFLSALPRRLFDHYRNPISHSKRSAATYDHFFFKIFLSMLQQFKDSGKGGVPLQFWHAEKNMDSHGMTPTRSFWNCFVELKLKLNLGRWAQ